MEEGDVIKDSKEKKKKKSGVKKSESSKSSGRKSSSATVSDSKAAVVEMNGEVGSVDATSEKRTSVSAEAPGTDVPSQNDTATATAGIVDTSAEVRPQYTPVNCEEQSSVAEALGKDSHVVENSVDEQRNDSVVSGDVRNDSPRADHYKVPTQATKKDISLLRDIDDAKLLELKEAFDLFDFNQDGLIDYEDLKFTLLSLGDTNITEEGIRNMLHETPGLLDFDAFVVLLGYKTIELDPEETILEALSRWDYDNSGFILEERIRHDLMTFGDKFSRKEVDVALEDAPLYINNKGQAMIDYVKFCSALSGVRRKPKNE